MKKKHRWVGSELQFKASWLNRAGRVMWSTGSRWTIPVMEWRLKDDMIGRRRPKTRWSDQIKKMWG